MQYMVVIFCDSHTLVTPQKSLTFEQLDSLHLLLQGCISSVTSGVNK